MRYRKTDKSCWSTETGWTKATTCKREKRCYKISESITIAVLAFHSKAHTSASKVFLAFEIWVFLSLMCSGHHSQTEMDILYYHSEFYCVSLAFAMQQWEQRFVLKISLPGESKKGDSQWGIMCTPHHQHWESPGYSTMQIHHSQQKQFKRGLRKKNPPSAKKSALPLLSVAHMDRWTELSTSEHKVSASRSWWAPGWGHNSTLLHWGAETPCSSVGCSYACPKA